MHSVAYDIHLAVIPSSKVPQIGSSVNIHQNLKVIGYTTTVTAMAQLV